MEKMKFRWGETAIFFVIIVLLTMGTYSRNGLWNDTIRLYHLKMALMLDRSLPNRGEVRRLVRALEGLP